MSNLDIRVVKLPAMRVVCVNGFGDGPEGKAFDKMREWAKAHNQPVGPHRVFGYNNPDPTPGSPNYGYDVWLTVDESVQADNDARIINFPGGLYAVARIVVQNPGDEIPNAWQKLVKWMEASKYRHGRHQWLEEHIGALDDTVNELPLTLDLHLPITE
jgi:AraC family transcriptional regulator